MQADRPKQYLRLGNKTILEQTLDKLLSFAPITGAVVVLNKSDEYWSKLNYRSSKPVLITIGGNERHHSVLNGLLRLKQINANNPMVLVHDAVRPLVTHTDLTNLLAAVENYSDGGLLASPVADTLKRANMKGQCQSTVSRNQLWHAFTPQAFTLNLLLRALNYVVENDLQITDDASAVELLGCSPRLVTSSVENIKITRSDDLNLVKAIFDFQHKNK